MIVLKFLITEICETIPKYKGIFVENCTDWQVIDRVNSPTVFWYLQHCTAAWDAT